MSSLLFYFHYLDGNFVSFSCGNMIKQKGNIGSCIVFKEKMCAIHSLETITSYKFLQWQRIFSDFSCIYRRNLRPYIIFCIEKKLK